MMRPLVLALLLLLPLPGLAQDLEKSRPEEVNSFFSSREVLARIPFAPGSADLGADGRDALKLLLPRLRSLDLANKLLRIEGQGGSADRAAMTLAMMRAKAVSDYLRERLPDFDLLTLTAQVAPQSPDSGKHSKNLVEVAIYDNLLDIHSAEIEQTIIR